ncbi:hypothetical protein FACS189499_08590 [Clostridia bacterium]|nr:hypothetical protein FACS189499_08590 [Clostridia bacterium]
MILLKEHPKFKTAIIIFFFLLTFVYGINVSNNFVKFNINYDLTDGDIKNLKKIYNYISWEEVDLLYAYDKGIDEHGVVLRLNSGSIDDYLTKWIDNDELLKQIKLKLFDSENLGDERAVSNKFKCKGALFDTDNYDDDFGSFSEAFVYFYDDYYYIMLSHFT